MLYRHYVTTCMQQSKSELTSACLFTDIVRFLVANYNDNKLAVEQYVLCRHIEQFEEVCTL